jgi:peptide-methionine (S)-S-oxide reductase
VGYAGGTTSFPNYNNIGDYSETVQVDYDPTQITYGKLLDAFWHSHNPTADTEVVQYRFVIFYHDEEQKTAALESMEREEMRLGRKIYTAIIPYTNFYLAEDYHQKYYLRLNSVLYHELYSIYPDPGDLLNSTASARLNGYIGGFGDEATVLSQLDKLGLSEAGREELQLMVKSGLQAVCPIAQ